MSSIMVLQGVVPADDGRAQEVEVLQEAYGVELNQGLVPEDDGHVVNGAAGVGQPSGKDLRDQQRFAAYFALQVIQSKHGKIEKKDKELVAGLLKTSLRTVEKIWKEARQQIAEGKEVDVSSKKKGRVGRKKKDLDLSGMSTIPLNRRKTLIAAAAKKQEQSSISN